MKILVCGGRKYGDLKDKELVADTPLWHRRWAECRHVHRVLDIAALEFSAFYDPDPEYIWFPSDIAIIHGGARGADACAHEWATVNWTKCYMFKADWDKHGRAAGPIRNQQMIDDGNPDIVFAFPGGSGTRDMVSRARDAEIPVRMIKSLDVYDKINCGMMEELV